MTTVNGQALYGANAGAGTVTQLWVRSPQIIDKPTSTLFPQWKQVPVEVNGDFTVTLDGGPWQFRFALQGYYPGYDEVWTREVPASGTVEYSTLPYLDPNTLLPTTVLQPAYVAQFEQVLAEAEGFATAAEGAKTTAVAAAGAAATEANLQIAPAVAEAQAIRDGMNADLAEWAVDTTDTAQASNLSTPGTLSKEALDAALATLVQWAKNPDQIIAGAVTGDPVASAEVVWPDGQPGTLTITARHATGAVNAYNITYGDPAAKTFTQPAITRATSGVPTNVPQIVVS